MWSDQRHISLLIKDSKMVKPFVLSKVQFDLKVNTEQLSSSYSHAMFRFPKIRFLMPSLPFCMV
jgi:hypothetical protein